MLYLCLTGGGKSFTAKHSRPNSGVPEVLKLLPGLIRVLYKLSNTN